MNNQGQREQPSPLWGLGQCPLQGHILKAPSYGRGFFTFNAQDWFNNTSNVAIQGIGRLKLGSSFAPEDNGASNPHLYQTTLDLAALNLNQFIASITFTKPTNAAAQQTCGIFAVSGFAAYREPVITQQPTPTNLCRLD